MDIKTIQEAIKTLPDVKELNDMQRRMSQDAARASGATLLLAPTGSGKTLAFALPLLARVKEGRGLQAIVLAPSRELVLQTAEVVRTLAAPHGIKTTALYGGHPFREESASLKVVPEIVVATPGRLLDHITRSSLDVTHAATLVIDEYDKSLELGFEEEMRRIVRRMKNLQRLVLTSATVLSELPAWFPTMPGYTETIDFTPSEKPGARNSGRLEVIEVDSPVRDKLDTLVDLLRGMDNGKVIVFANHRESAERVWQRLSDEGLPVGLYHGGLDQPQRENAVEMLDNGTTPVLVATDLAARGLDITAVDAVVHYHMPPTFEVWTHRNGRTARQDASGRVYVIVSEADDVADYIRPNRSLIPSGKHSSKPIVSEVSTLMLNLGRKDKISRGDVVGYLIAKGGLEAAEIGRIGLRDHCVLVAVPRSKAKALVKALASEKIKNKRVKISILG